VQPTIPKLLLGSLSDVLAARLGLHFPANRWDDLARGIVAAAPDFGMPDALSCAHWLLSAPITQREVEILARHLTVGETYFFREKASFDVFEQHIVPALLHAQAGAERRLRLWSAGCCTGEEAYSIAMLLDRLIPDADAWHTTVLATDINPAFLRKAAIGEYGEWSFRSTPDWIKDRYFRPVRGGRFKLDERIRKRVSFSHLNLAADTYPTLTSNTNAMDVIFCRNVLMYFSAEGARRVIDHFYRALVDGGWLIVSPAETSSALFSRFTTVAFDGAILYRKEASASAPSVARTDSLPASWRLTELATPAVEALPEVMPAASQAVAAGNDSAPIPAEPAQLIGQARDCANQGQLDEAAVWCGRAIAADKLNPAHHYLMAVIEQEQGQGDAAAQSLARALYLAPHFVIAHYALGNLRRSQGRHGEARRHIANALASLRTLSPDEMLAESDGLTAGRLIEIIESMPSGRAPSAASLPSRSTIHNKKGYYA
jgi:chemotaxis protein methyltransferase CheR